MMTPNDPWPEFIEKYLYSMLRGFVTRHGMVSAKHYVRTERLLRRFVAGKERELKRAVLDGVLARWEKRLGQAEGATLEEAFREALAEVAEGDPSRAGDMADSQGFSAASTDADFHPTDRLSQSPVPQSGVRQREAKDRAV